MAVLCGDSIKRVMTSLFLLFVGKVKEEIYMATPRGAPIQRAGGVGEEIVKKKKKKEKKAQVKFHW